MTLKLASKTEIVELDGLQAKFDRMASDQSISQRLRVEAAVIAGCINFTIDGLNARAVSVDVQSEMMQ